MTLIPQLPPPPQSTDPVNFDPRADAFLLALVFFAEAANQQAAENNQAAAAAAASAVKAAASDASARNASDLAVSAAAAGRFDPTATYAVKDLAWSPVSGLIYRRLIAGRTATDPSADKVNWLECANLPAGPDADQVPAGQQLGRLAFLDVLGALMHSKSQPGALGSIWFERVSDTSLKLFMRGDDGTARSVTLTLS